jgi:hypothetical protein
MLLETFCSESEIAAELTARLGKGDWRRRLREMRAKGIGPAWAKLPPTKTVIYPIESFEDWLRALVRQPINNKTKRPGVCAPGRDRLGRSSKR